MNAASFLSAVIEIAVGVAGFAGIVAAVRQRRLDHWPKAQLLLLQVLFTTTAAAIAFALLPSFLFELGLDERLVWRTGSAALICWIVGALAFRYRQSRVYGVAMPIPRYIRALGVVSIALQTFNIVNAGVAWPFMFGIMMILMNGFSVFLLLVLRPLDDDAEPAPSPGADTEAG